MDLLVVGGVPGAGKSTALRHHVGTRGVLVLDPDRMRGILRWRPLVHLVHQVLLWGTVSVGPRLLRRLGVRLVLAQDTATRTRRRTALLKLASRRGWRSALWFIDASREEALSGQFARGRMVDEAAFERHWKRWELLRDHGQQVVMSRAALTTRLDVSVARATGVWPSARPGARPPARRDPGTHVADYRE